MANLVEDLLALDGEGAEAGRSRKPRLRDVALEAVEVELQRLELEFGRGGLEAVRVDRQLGHEAGEVLVAAREVRARVAQVHAQILGGLAARGRGEVVLDV